MSDEDTCNCHCHCHKEDEKTHIDKINDFADFMIKVKESIVAVATIIVVLMMANSAYHLATNDIESLDSIEKGIISLGMGSLTGPLTAVSVAGIPVDPTFRKPEAVVNAAKQQSSFYTR